MIARSASWSEHRPEIRQALGAAALGAVLFLASFAILHTGPFDGHQIIDTPVYQRYGDAIVDYREVPYRDFSLEYPPAALPMFVLPSFAPGSDYRTAFETLVALCGVGIVALVVSALVSVGATAERLYGAAAFVGLAPLALGPVILTRFDVWPALLSVGAVAALVAGRGRLAFGVLAVAVAAKIYPVVLLPIALVYLARRHGGRETAIALAVFAGVLAVILLPFAVMDWHGLWSSVERQTGRPLQIESLGSAILLAAHRIGIYEPLAVSSFGSQNLAGSLPDALATVLTSLQILAVVGIWLLFATRRGLREELLAGSAACVATFVALGKVVSPQFLIWLVPLAPLIAGRRGLAASGLLGLALVLTQLWFPRIYWHLVAFEPLPVWLLVARDVALIAVAVVSAAALARGRAPSRNE